MIKLINKIKLSKNKTEDNLNLKNINSNKINKIKNFVKFNKKKKYKKNKKIGLYKTFDTYKKQLDFITTKYEKLKDSVKNFSLVKEKIKDNIINYNNKFLYGNIEYKFKGKTRTDEFSFFFKKKMKDKEFFDIFKLKNLILKEAFSKLNRHGKAFKHIYDIIYRKILKYPYLITIKPKTIIVLNYKNLMQYVFEWKYNKKLNKEILLENKDLNIKKWISMKSIDKSINKLNIFIKLNIFNFCIYNDYLKKYNKKLLFSVVNKNHRILILIRNIFIKLEFNNLINMKRRILDLNECLTILSYDYIKEECENLYLYYIKDIKRRDSYFSNKEKLFTLIFKKINTILKRKNLLKNNINLSFLPKTIELIKQLINYKKYNIYLQKTIYPLKSLKDTFFFKEKKMENKLNWITKNMNINDNLIKIKYNRNLLSLKYNFLYKLYFLYFFWAMFYLNKIFFYLNKIFFNIWNRYYYFYQNSYDLENNILFYTYIILYKNIYLGVEFENKWNIFLKFIEKNIKYHKNNFFITYKLWRNIYNKIFIINNNSINNYVFNLYNKHFININLYKYLYKNTWNYEKIDRINNIIDNIWKNDYNIFHNYNYFSVWKVPSTLNIDVINKPINLLYLEYKKVNNFLENFHINNKTLMKDYLIDPEIYDNIYTYNKLNKNKNKLWYK